ncbi:putative GTP-binding protein 6 [Bombina bombina]|uniref:putative GTP-binding protein 6 n=1 Tax=Bombina bombina TaxID=8345 RepID=UPI00235AABF9|nr:putative GTP-binding protein 6 [Bombina bombina]
MSWKHRLQAMSVLRHWLLWTSRPCAVRMFSAVHTATRKSVDALAKAHSLPLVSHTPVSTALPNTLGHNHCLWFRFICTSSPAQKAGGRRDDRDPGNRADADYVEEEQEEETEEETEEDVDELLSPQTVIEGAQRIFIVHPDVKWGTKKLHLTTAELQVAEAEALVHSLPNWTVIDKLIMSTKSPDSKFIFGKGNFQILTEMLKGHSHITAVFVNMEKISSVAKKELEAAWGVKVFDRYTVVLNIFRYNARTREAKLQIALAEIPLLRSNLKNELAHMDQQGGGSRYIMGSGETFTEVQQRLLKERELKIKHALEKLRKKRNLLRTQRRRREFPIISVMGYTNCGKTTLIKALTGDADLQPRDQLFATLDVTTHAGLLPCRMPVLYVDTIGFLSQLPHNLIESFSATLEDVVYSDLIVHVRDISHPEATNQKTSVLSVLKNLNIPHHLLDTMVEVHNKIDLVEKYEASADALPLSALLGHGLEDLKQQIETGVMRSTGRNIVTINVNLASPQLSWLYKEASVQEVNVLPEDGRANVRVIITTAALGKYKKQFPG